MSGAREGRVVNVAERWSDFSVCYSSLSRLPTHPAAPKSLAYGSSTARQVQYEELEMLVKP